MAAEQPSVELTARDVFQQIDRRLSLMEGDLRALDVKLDTKFHWMLGILIASWISILVAVLFK